MRTTGRAKRAGSLHPADFLPLFVSQTGWFSACVKVNASYVKLLRRLKMSQVSRPGEFI